MNGRKVISVNKNMEFNIRVAPTLVKPYIVEFRIKSSDKDFLFSINSLITQKRIVINMQKTFLSTFRFSSIKAVLFSYKGYENWGENQKILDVLGVNEFRFDTKKEASDAIVSISKTVGEFLERQMKEYIKHKN